MVTPKRKPDTVSDPQPSNVDIDPRWLLRALGLSVLAAVLLGYLSVCLLIYQGGWQRMLHPVGTIDRTPAEFAIPFDTVRFDASATGQPRLSGWWMPTDMPGAPTILYLHDGAGSLSSALHQLELLRRANVNILAIDYRGYGQSEGPHPTEACMQQDAAAALDYLTSTRHLAASRIVPYGFGLGSVLALNLAAAHPELPAVIVESPDPDALGRVLRDDRSRLLPMRSLVQEHFDLTRALAGCHQPRLLLADSPSGGEESRARASQAAFRSAPDPKMTVTFDNAHAEGAYLATLRRFLDENLH